MSGRFCPSAIGFLPNILAICVFRIRFAIAALVIIFVGALLSIVTRQSDALLAAQLPADHMKCFGLFRPDAGTTLDAEPTSVVRLQPQINIPYTVQYSFGVERQLQKSTTVSATYVGSRGVDLFRSRDANAPLPPFYLARPDSALGVVRRIESAGRMPRGKARNTS